jgi:hypothetical protein
MVWFLYYAYSPLRLLAFQAVVNNFTNLGYSRLSQQFDLKRLPNIGGFVVKTTWATSSPPVVAGQGPARRKHR